MSAKGPDRSTEGNPKWETPQHIFDWLNSIYKITLDGAAEASNTKCDRYYSPEDDAFKQEPEGEVIFVNPPYDNLRPWVDLFIRWAENNSVVVLLPANVETQWGMKLVNSPLCRSVTFLSPRIQFVKPSDRDKRSSSNTNGSMVVLLHKGKDRNVSFVNWKEAIRDGQLR